MLEWQKMGYNPVVELPPQPQRPEPEPEGPTPEEMVEREDKLALRKLEQQLKDALRARSTYHLSEHRIMKKAFAKFDADCSGSVDFDEFSHALEHMGLHTRDHGLPGWGGVKPGVMRMLFDKFDADQGGTIA